MVKVQIVADSACDLDIEYIKSLGGEFAPLTTTINEKTYTDREELSPKEFYEILENSKDLPKTSQVTPARFKEIFERAIKSGKEVVYVGFSSKLSGTYQSAYIARELIDEKEKIRIIDSKCASVGLGLLVERAAVMANEGKSVDEIVSEITYMKDRMEHIIGVGSLDLLKKGGRISGSQAVIGNLLNVKPIINMIDGSLIPLTKARGNKGAIKKMISIIEERGHDIENQRIGINYAKDLDFANELKDEITKQFGVKDFLISEVGAVIGSHVGPGTVSVFFLRK